MISARRVADACIAPVVARRGPRREGATSPNSRIGCARCVVPPQAVRCYAGNGLDALAWNWLEGVT
jgi:hypothetical protein